MKMKCLFVFILLLTFTGSYKEEAKAANNFDLTKELTIMAPKFTQPPVDFEAKPGQTVSIIARFTGTPEPRAELLKNNLGILPSWKINASCDKGVMTITITGVDLSDAGTYAIKISNSAGSVTAYFRLFVNHN